MHGGGPQLNISLILKVYPGFQKKELMGGKGGGGQAKHDYFVCSFPPPPITPINFPIFNFSELQPRDNTVMFLKESI